MNVASYHAKVQGNRCMFLKCVEEMDKVKTIPVSIGMVGRTSAGKSSLLNRMFGTTCKVRATRCTTGVQEVWRYADADMHNCISIWHVFGFNDVEAYESIETIKEFVSLHAVLLLYRDDICSCKNTIELFRAADVKVVVVRSQIDTLEPEELQEIEEVEARQAYKYGAHHWTKATTTSGTSADELKKYLIDLTHQLRSERPASMTAMRECGILEAEETTLKVEQARLEQMLAHQNYDTDDRVENSSAGVEGWTTLSDALEATAASELQVRRAGEARQLPRLTCTRSARLSEKELKEMLCARNVDCTGCCEKGHLVEMVKALDSTDCTSPRAETESHAQATDIETPETVPRHSYSTGSSCIPSPLHTKPAPFHNLDMDFRDLDPAGVDSAAAMPKAWSVGEVAAFLDGLSFVNAASLVRANGVDGKTFLDLTDMDLKDELTLHNLQVKRLRKEIEVMTTTRL